MSKRHAAKINTKYGVSVASAGELKLETSSYMELIELFESVR